MSSEQAIQPATLELTKAMAWKPLALVLAMVVAGCLAHGLLDGRWSIGEDLRQKGGELDQLPEQIGAWSFVESQPLGDSAAKMLSCYGSTVRVYQNATGDRITVAVLYGPRGPIAVHTPEICYDSVGTKLVGSRIAKQIGVHRLWMTQFAESQSPEPSFEVWYGWSDGGKWVAAERPRFWMTSNLYKIQLSGPLGTESSRPCQEFLEEFLPQLNEIIE